MIASSPYTLPLAAAGSADMLQRGSWLMILHASRVPPHVGVMIDGSYSSLTIKGHEIGVRLEVLMQTITRKRIEALAVSLVKQPVFSTDFQREALELYIRQFPKVEAGKASCLSPVKLFLQEFYALQARPQELLYEVTERLKLNGYIGRAIGFNLPDSYSGEYALPVYSHERLQEVIAFETSQHA